MVEPELSARTSHGEQLMGGAANGVDWEPAPLARRFGALLVDWILCLLITGIFANPRTQGWYPVLILIAEYGFFLGLFGQTPGMWVTRLSCVGFADGRPIGVPRALLRGVLLALVVPTLIMDTDRRGLHDRAAGSVVIANPPRGA